ncbi:MAG: hypothetical protein HZA35_00795 [Parcubacteria group bacterium]|nr:hypothetical protein [Parcubacteria group bacterium]
MLSESFPSGPSKTPGQIQRKREREEERKAELLSTDPEDRTEVNKQEEKDKLPSNETLSSLGRKVRNVIFTLSTLAALYMPMGNKDGAYAAETSKHSDRGEVHMVSGLERGEFITVAPGVTVEKKANTFRKLHKLNIDGQGKFSHFKMANGDEGDITPSGITKCTVNGLNFTIDNRARHEAMNGVSAYIEHDTITLTPISADMNSELQITGLTQNREEIPRTGSESTINK